jgi:hypothetical protein
MGKFIKALFCMVLLFIAHEGFSVTGPPAPPTPQNIPIDGGLSWLLAAGGIYGVSKLRKKFKK